MTVNRYEGLAIAIALLIVGRVLVDQVHAIGSLGDDVTLGELADDAQVGEPGTREGG